MKINHIRKRIPTFRAPPFRGRTYEAMVPDTVDIQQRMRLAVNGLTGPTDPDKEHQIYFRVNFRANPPCMTHDESDMCQTKFMEALALLRMASGSQLNTQVDPDWMAVGLKMIGPDGLAYWPSLPWAPCSMHMRSARGATHYAEPWCNGRLISAMTVYMLRDPDGPWRREIKKVVDGLHGIAIEQDDFAYFPAGGFLPGRKRLRSAPMPLGSESSHAGWTLHGLAQFHRVTGDKRAVDLASRLARYLAFHGRYFGTDGAFLPAVPIDQQGQVERNPLEQDLVPSLIHFQHHAIPLLGILDHAVAADEPELKQFVRASFEWAMTKGHSRLGYFPENVDNPDELETSELCEVANMIALALKLSAANLGDYWDAADQWIRNHFVEGQLTRPEWVYHMAEGGLVTGKTRVPPSAIDPVSQTCDRVPERNLGAFAGWPTANDWFVGHGSGIMHCCTGNGARALYYIWQHMLRHERGTLSINLLMNRPSKWADVNSHLPYRGQVDVSVKRACRQLRVRMPHWSSRRHVRCRVNGRKRTLDGDGRYVLAGPVKARDQVEITFGLQEQKVEVDIQAQHYHLITRGSEVVDIYPRGRFFPLYQRDHYRNDQTRWHHVERFVSDEEFPW